MIYEMAQTKWCKYDEKNKEKEGYCIACGDPL